MQPAATFRPCMCRECDCARKRKYNAENKQKRREARAREAAAAGRDFDVNGQHDAHCRAYHKQGMKRFISDARVVARMMEAVFKPWLATGISDAEYYKTRYARDPEFAIKERMRRQIKKATKRDGIGDVMRGALVRNGSSSTVCELLGYTIGQLRAHIEGLFSDGMDWAAFMRGEIHIDHVIPKASFDLSIDEQWRACWAISNLQPLWASDNMSKSDRMPCGNRGRDMRQAA